MRLLLSVSHVDRRDRCSYQTPTGIVSGIQWIPAEATEILPAGAQPATEVRLVLSMIHTDVDQQPQEFAASWQRGYLSKDEQRSLKDWCVLSSRDRSARID